MCGIAGIIGKKDNIPVKEYLNIFKHALFHRGPDEYGEYTGQNCGFINLRLSIVDIAGGRQPIFNEDNTIGIVYNGEVYNYNDIKQDLLKKGYIFKTNTDTEVILKSYEEYGIEAFNKFNGMFAFCIWDNKKDIIYLVRDYFGIKPLYIYEDDKKIIFSSELKGILAISDIDLSLDPAGFQDYLIFRYIQSPYSFFKKIRRLEGGRYVKIKNGKATSYTYGDISYKDTYPYKDVNEVKEELLEKIKKAVKSQLMGEVPIGVLLSGGIDSSTIAYLIHSCGANLTTFNIGFPEVNEFEYSREVAEKYNLQHIEVLTTAEELIKNLDNIILSLDEPIADPACLPLYILCEELKKHVTVVLSGEGGDEVFAGYPQYKQMMSEDIPYNKRFESFLEKSWYFNNHLKFLKDPFMAPHNLRYRKYFEEQPLLNGMMAYDMKTWMPENLMMKADKILMAHSLEGRFPFLDRELFEYTSQLPQCYKLHPDGTAKWILKEIIHSHLPERIINRPKMGFTVPVDKLLESLKPLVLDVFNSLSSTPLPDILDIEYMKNYVNNYYKGHNISSLQIWSLFVMSYWFSYAFPGYKNSVSNLLEKIEINRINKELSRRNVFRRRDRIRCEIAKPFLKGKGIEIGAGNYPQIIPQGIVVEHFDKRTDKELKEYFDVDKIEINNIYPLEILPERFPDGADFLIGHNVLEHVSNPIKTLIEWNSYVKNGGVVIISVPHPDYCPDKGRLIPPFEHILSDYLLDRDDNNFESREHFYSFRTGWIDEGFAKGMDKMEFAKLSNEHIKNKEMEIHWHVFSEELLKNIIITSGYVGKRKINIELIATPDNSNNNLITEGDIICIYRVDLLEDNKQDNKIIKEINKIEEKIKSGLDKVNIAIKRLNTEG